MINIDQLVRLNIKKLKPYSSARDSYQSGILLDANENSLGSVVENKLQLNRYPDPSQAEMRSKLSTYLNVDSSKLFFGVGSDEIIDLLIRIFCEPSKDNVIIPLPTYGMYKVCCDINNVKVKNVELTKDFQIDLNPTLNSFDKHSKIIFLCSPNNPTSKVLNKQDVKTICDEFDGIVVVDEAYIDFDEKSGMQELINEFNNLVILRTFSKAWGLAGIRCGYCIADEKIISYLFKVKAPYSISSLTSNAVINAINNVEQKQKFVSKILDERDRILQELNNIEEIHEVFASNANFLIFKVSNAKQVYSDLAEAGVIIRDRSSETNMENCLRVTIGTPEENNTFIKKLKQVL
jgi:histidinol-phosphate aminotransferase